MFSTERKKKGKTICWTGVLLFWGIMAALTVRMWYQREYNTPVVSYCYSHRDSISHETEGEGQICFEKTGRMDYRRALPVIQCAVQPGDAVKAGDPLFRYDPGSVRERLEDQELALLECRFLMSRIADETYRELLTARISRCLEEADALEQLRSGDGWATADADGWITGVDEEGISLGFGAVSVEGRISASCETPDQLIGTEVSVNMGTPVSGRLTACSREGNLLRCVIEPDRMEQYLPDVTFSLKWEGETYPVCIPRGALHTEGGSCYVYVLEERTGILGNTYIAAKRDVLPLEMNDALAAVDGNLPATEKIISGSSGQLYDGCPVSTGD